VIDNKGAINVLQPCLQKEFAGLIGVGEDVVSGLCKKGVIKPGQTLGEWLHLYCKHLREYAAGRATDNGLNLASERAALAREQTIRIEMQNAVTRREYGPIDAMEQGLADAMARVAAQLDTIPGKLKISSDKLTANDLDLVASIIAQVRNDIAEMDIDWFGDKSTDENDDN
jgi:phage terminase Nu1 subunit (DNA packaging protein)